MSRPLPAKSRRALSIVEMVISLAIAAMLLTAVAAAFTASAAAVEVNDDFFRASQAARVSLNQILTDLRRSDGVEVPTSTLVEVITWDGLDRGYQYDAVNAQIKLITNDVTTDPDYVLARNVTACAFAADTSVDAQGITHYVRISVTLTVQVGENRITLTGSVAPRREQQFD